MSRRVPRPRAGARRPLLLPPPADPRRRVAKRLPDRPAEGQARQPLERLGRDPARGRGRTPRRRRGPRRRDDHRDGHPHASRLRPRVDGAHAAGGRRGDPPRRPSCRVRPPPLGAAADAERARGPLPRLGGGDRDGHAPGAGLRRGRPRVPPSRDRRREVLGLQGDAAARRRGARVPRRQRLRRGVGPAPPLPREPASTRCGRGRGTSTASTSSARSAGSRRAAEAFVAELERRARRRPPPRRGAPRLGRELDEADEAGARRLVERLALALQASLLVRHAPAEVADAFCATRLGGEGGRAYGTLPAGRGRRRDRRAPPTRCSGSVRSVRVEIFYCPV